MVPTPAELAARGLLDTEIDDTHAHVPSVPVDHAHDPTTEWTTGWGHLHPEPEYPTILERPPGTVVRWQ
jgi:hypothetical protein